MKYEQLYNFISPLTGKLPIDRGYILIGDKDGRSFASPLLIDVRQDIIDLRRKIGRFEKLEYNKIWIGDKNKKPIPQTHIGVINLPVLGAATFPYPDLIPLPAVPIPNPTFNPLSGFDWLMSGPWLPQIFAGSPNTLNTSSETVISSSLAMTQVKVAQAIKRLDVTGFIVKSKNIDFIWDNPAIALLPETIKQLYGLSTNYTFTNAQALDEIGAGLIKNSSDGILSTAISGEDYVNTSAIIAGPLVMIDPLYPLTGHKLIAPTTFSSRGNEVNEFGYPIANTIDILTGTAGKFVKFAVTGIAAASLLKVDNFGEIKAAIPNTDYLSNTLPEDKLFYGDNTDKVSVVSNIKKKNLPPLGLTSIQDIGDLIGVDLGALGFDLPLGKIYRGTDSEIPEESNSLSILQASFWANNLLTRFIIGTGSFLDRLTFPASQFISDLPPGILQHIGGILVTATPGVDYATPEQLEELRDEAKQAADDAAEAAADAADAASDAAGYVDDAAAAVSAAVVAAIFSGALAGAIADAESAADDAEDSADDAAGYANDAQDALNSLLNTQVTLQGDIAATGPLTGALSTTFTPNPSFSGAQYMRIPTGSTAQRPLFPEVGMVRYNTDI
jgi:hypothetical protein